MNRSPKCYVCKEKDAHEKRLAARQKILAEAKARGLVQLHSCISALLDPMPKTCRCRKFVNFEVAREYIRLGRAVDFRTRTASFYERGIVEVSKHKNPPLSTIGSRVAVERVVVTSGGNKFDKAEIARLTQTVAEDQAWRKVERDSKIDIEHDIAVEEQAKLIVFVDEKEFEDMKQRSWGRPDLFVTKDERTSLGRDVGSLRLESPIDADVDESDTEPPEENDESGETIEEVDQIERREEPEEMETETELETERDEMAVAA